MQKNRISYMAGFSMIELLIALAIIGVLFKVAISNYEGVVNRKARAAAVEGLEMLAARQEQFKQANQQYARKISQLKVEPLMEQGDYLLSVKGKWNAFVLTADPAGEGTSGKMAEDGKLRMDFKGVKSWDCDNDGSFRCSWEDATK
ncbi:MAG: prepilin-type N-terminal cleavage/methylation domain-containing protein [Gammaproteobacteria bacterium]|nr:prepilin-type N-terminal cleavage/methylation domain-containing protein [Gammaproteobacteria bacterium]